MIERPDSGHTTITPTERIAFITGATSGIGRVTALMLAELGYRVFLAGRSEIDAQGVIDEIRLRTGRTDTIWLSLDLADLASVQRCAREFLATGLPLHLLINNAGMGGGRGLTPNGFEITFGVNHLGHFLLTNLLLDRLKASGPSRVVTVASKAHTRVRGIDWSSLQRPRQSLTGIPEYAGSKLANILFSAELARRLQGTSVSAYALHPGLIYTRIWRTVPALLRPLLKLRGMISVEAGAATTLYCATRAPQSESGLYYANSQVATPASWAQDHAAAQRLWRESEAWVADFMRTA
jgi:NAD(P)-dependent dehydrogenase (short-subunit alcohol dehydrogenase family)